MNKPKSYPWVIAQHYFDIKYPDQKLKPVARDLRQAKDVLKAHMERTGKSDIDALPDIIGCIEWLYKRWEGTQIGDNWTIAAVGRWLPQYMKEKRKETVLFEKAQKARLPVSEEL